MIVSHVILKNWRNFRAVDVPLGERIFLVGPNASGKSNFLDVFRFLRDIAKQGGGLQYAIQQRGGLSKIRCLAARKHPDVELEICLTDLNGERVEWRYAIGIKQEVRGYRYPYLSYEKVWKNNRQLVNRPDENDQKDKLRLTQTHLEQINANEPFREISRFLESTLYLHLIPQILRYPDSFSGHEMPGDPFGKNFMERVMNTPEKTRRARLKKIETALRSAVPQLNELKDTMDNKGIPHLEAVYSHWRPKAGKQREDQFSDGTLRLVGLLWSLLDGESLLLLEEPELSLHSAIIRRLPALIHRIQRKKKRQVVLSTHSADLLAVQGIGAEEVLLLTPTKEGTNVQMASLNKVVRALLESGLSVAEAALPQTAPSEILQMEFFEA